MSGIDAVVALLLQPLVFHWAKMNEMRPAFAETAGFEAASTESRARLHTQLDTWITAACMTVLLPITGPIFALTCVPILWGLRRRVDSADPESVERRLRWARRVLWSGVAVSFLASSGMFIQTFFGIADSIPTRGAP